MTQGGIQMFIMFDDDCISPILFEVDLSHHIVGDAVHHKFHCSVGGGQDHLVVAEVIGQQVTTPHKLLLLHVGDHKIPGMPEFIFMGMLPVMALRHGPGPQER